jgi:MSHA biogenesis protein MshK
MSLVNDALRRAKEAQQKGAPAAAVPQLRPAAAAPIEKRGMGMTVPLVIATVAIVGLLFVWKNQHPAAAREPLPETKPIANPPAETKPVVQPVAVSTPAPVAPAAAMPTAAPVPVAAPAPALKLQAIFFAPGRSSAIISGKTVRVGNTFKGYRVAAITETSATLVSATGTNVMTLEQ